jgi:hypothetical protein
MKYPALVAAALVAFAPAASLAAGHHSSHSEVRRNTSEGSPGYHYVSAYTRHNGTVVQGHYQTNPNGTRNDNWSTRGNVNPFTGEPGTKPGD